MLLRCKLIALLFLVPVFYQQGIDRIQDTAASSPSEVSYHVVGKHILDTHNNIFIPYGVLIDGVFLAQPNWKTNGVLTHDALDQMQAAHDFWHSNTVRLQIGSKALFAQSPYDASYLAKIDEDVQWATQLGMNIILSLQYEGAGNSGQKMPTQDSLHFWNIIAPHYSHNQRVFFDLFNEPDITTILGHTDNDAAWSFWQNGGTGIDDKIYVGMQQLVNTIRKGGIQNLILAEGLASGEDISRLPEHTLDGVNIVYAVHPYLNDTNHHTAADWDRWFGNATTQGNFPVVADEWGEYQSTKGECVTDAPAVVSQFLSYLKNHAIGLIAYGLVPGALIRGWNFRNPTIYTQSTTVCTADTSNITSNGEGAGQMIRLYFIATGNPNGTPSQTPGTPQTPGTSQASFLHSFSVPLLMGGILLILLVSTVILFTRLGKKSK